MRTAGRVQAYGNTEAPAYRKPVDPEDSVQVTFLLRDFNANERAASRQRARLVGEVCLLVD
ncbi:MAG: hypothetical protein P8N09_07580 [Planctomycetota bacterium]|nr:hypothetical protein [Planctomycetota bacterium]